ncbi:hypothetical protein [Azospirillum soli]|nr:hypothetical protein [Azospirillum soli]MBP2311826.1 hypothetical protein [Azospirillum soli]
MTTGVGLALGASIAVAGVVLFAGPKTGADPTDTMQVAGTGRSTQRA